MISITALVLTVLMTPVSTSSSSSLMETLLKPTMKLATCQARCVGVSSEEMSECLQLCSEVLTHPSLSLCSYPRFCTGSCRAACQSSRPEQSRLISLVQQDCLLSWQLDQVDSAVFVVTGRDQGGMINIISSHQVVSSLPLTPHLTNKFTHITVTAVDSQGILNILGGSNLVDSLERIWFI